MSPTSFLSNLSDDRNRVFSLWKAIKYLKNQKPYSTNSQENGGWAVACL